MAIRLKKKQRLPEVVETTRAQSEKTSPDKSSVMSWWKRDWFFCLILAVVTMLAYQPAWHGGFLWGGDEDVKHNQLLIAPAGFRRGLVFALTAFFEFFAGFYISCVPCGAFRVVSL